MAPRTPEATHSYNQTCVRGLLCWPCNSFLGRIEDRPESLIAYLSRGGGPA